jgi:SAM-dependent methyltransferase
MWKEEQGKFLKYKKIRMNMANQKIFDFKEVFETNDYLYFYEDSISKERTEKQIEFLVKELELHRPMDILDLACGHGRHSNRLAELGQRVVGIDIMQGFLDIAKTEADKKNITVGYQQGDMREITFSEKFDIALLLYTSLGYFEDDQNFKVLKNVYQALRHGGKFCFDSHNRDTTIKHLRPYNVLEKGNDLMIDRCEFDSSTGRLYNKRIVIRNGKRKDKPFFVRFYNPTEITQLLEKAGFDKIKMYADWDGNPFKSDSRGMIIVAQKS